LRWLMSVRGLEQWGCGCGKKGQSDPPPSIGGLMMSPGRKVRIAIVCNYMAFLIWGIQVETSGLQGVVNTRAELFKSRLNPSSQDMSLSTPPPLSNQMG
jgi:hypothetical protein